MATERSRPIERLASALQDCLDEAAQKGAQEAMSRIEPRLSRQDAAIRQMREHMDTRLDRQDDTLRMVWKQVKGNGKLPIDD